MRTKTTRTKIALLFAESLEVICPHCSGAQPDPGTGSFLWTAQQIRDLSDEERTRVCVECDEPLRIEVVRLAPLETAKAYKESLEAE